MPAIPTRVSDELLVIKQLHEHMVGGDMKASPQDQRSILDIQGFDFATSTLANKIKNLPEAIELSATIIKSNNARDLRIAAQTELSDVKRELLRAEGDVEQIVTRITRDEARLSGGSASPKELERIAKQKDFSKIIGVGEDVGRKAVNNASGQTGFDIGSQYAEANKQNAAGDTYKKGGKVKASSASRRADGIAQRGKTRGRMV